MQIFRGALAIGISRSDALALALRCARDSVPPLRLKVLRDVAAHENEDCQVSDVAGRLQKPWTTIDRMLQTLHVLRLPDCIKLDTKADDERQSPRHYSLARDVCLDALGEPNSSPTL